MASLPTDPKRFQCRSKVRARVNTDGLYPRTKGEGLLETGAWLDFRSDSLDSGYTLASHLASCAMVTACRLFAFSFSNGWHTPHSMDITAAFSGVQSFVLNLPVFWCQGRVQSASTSLPRRLFPPWHGVKHHQSATHQGTQGAASNQSKNPSGEGSTLAGGTACGIQAWTIRAHTHGLTWVFLSVRLWWPRKPTNYGVICAG